MKEEKIFIWWRLTVIQDDEVIIAVISKSKDEIVGVEKAIKKIKDPDDTEIRIKNYKFREDISVGYKVLNGYDMYVRNWEGKLYAGSINPDGSLKLFKVNEDDLI